MSPPLKSILFVCLGNICRSPAAEGVMQSLIDAEGLSDLIRVDSAGTSGYHIDAPADARMRRAATARGITLTSRSRMVTPHDLQRFDLVIAMDHDNFRQLQGLTAGPHHNVRLLSDFLEERWPREVPDPYYGGDEGFEQVLDMLQAACPRLLAELRRK